MRLLSLTDLLDAFDEFENGAAPIRDLGTLESAVQRQHTTVFGHELYPTLDLKVAALVDAISRSHPLIDGNKRLAFIAARLTYFLNERPILVGTKEQIYELYMRIAGEHIEVPELAEILARTFVAESPTSNGTDVS